MKKERQKYLIKLLDTYCKPVKRQLSLLITIISVATVTQVLGITVLVNALINDIQNFTSYWVWFIVIAASFALKAIVIYWRSLITQRLSMQVKTIIRNLIVERIDQLGSKGLARSTTEMAIFYIEQVDQLNNYLARFYPQTIASRIQPVVILLAVFAMNWVAGLILLLTSPLLPIFMILIGIKTSEMNERQFKSLLYLGNQFHDKLVGIKTIIAYSQQPRALKHIAHSSQNYTDTTIALLRIAFLNSAVLEFLSSVCIALMALYFGLSYLEHNHVGSYGVTISLLAGFFCLTLSGEFFQPLKDLGAFYHDRSSALNAIDEIERFITKPIEDNQEYVDLQTSEEANIAAAQEITISHSLSEKIEKHNLLESSLDSVNLATNTQVNSYAASSTASGNFIATTAKKTDTNVETDELTDTSPAEVAQDEGKGKKGKRRARNRQTDVPLLQITNDASIAQLHYPFSNPSKDLLLTEQSIIKATNLSIYTHSGKCLLSNLNFSWALNEKVALIGVSGSGKTTLLSVLLGLLPYTGSLTFNDVELTDLHKEQFYAYFSWLGQNPNLEQTTIIDNLTFSSQYVSNHLTTEPSFGQEDSNFSKHFQALSSLSKYSIEQAIKLAKIDTLLSEKGKSYTIQQHNIGLSGGQVQRLALARALAKPHLYLLIDEPTANLDSKLETAVFSNITSHQQGIVMVTHRLEHSELFDRIFKLSEQGISEVSHA